MDKAITNRDPSDEEGYRAPQVCKVVGITYRQLDHWDRTGLLKPSLRAARGSGTQRLYSFPDLVQLRIIKGLLDTGISLARIRKAIAWLRSRSHEDEPLRDYTLLSDGIDIWASYSYDETRQYLMDILRRGQGVFAIAVGQVRQDLRGETLELFPTRAHPGGVEAGVEATAT